MRYVALVLTLIVLLSAVASADWDSARSHGLIPYWQTGENWYTLLIFVNISEETGDVISIRFIDTNG